MSTYEFKGRQVEVEVEIEVGEGATVTVAEYVDTGEALTEAEMEQLSYECQDELYQDAYERLAGRAYDHFKDQMKYGDT